MDKISVIIGNGKIVMTIPDKYPDKTIVIQELHTCRIDKDGRVVKHEVRNIMQSKRGGIYLN